MTESTSAQPDDAASTVETVVAAITEGVRGGLLAPGQRLVEADFTKRLGVGRGSVREAFRRLTADGLLAFVPHRGVSVRQLTRAEVDNLFDIRAALEVLAVQLALPRLEAEPAALLDLQARLDAAEAAGDMAGFSGLNRDWHGLLAAAAANPQLDQMIGRLGNSIYWLQFRVLVDREPTFATNVQHRAVTAAIVAGDTDAAARAMRAHVDGSRRLIQALPDSCFAA